MTNSLKTAALLAALALANSVQAAPVVRIFKIQSDTAQQARFNRVGEARCYGISGNITGL